jgi:hypothetical protein
VEEEPETPAAAPAAAADDGGPPLISAGRWAELKAFGWMGSLFRRIGSLFR